MNFIPCPTGRVWGWLASPDNGLRVQYATHDQTGGYIPPVFFGRLHLELEAVGWVFRGLSGFLYLQRWN